jgi:hypothetical protein
VSTTFNKKLAGLALGLMVLPGSQVFAFVQPMGQGGSFHFGIGQNYYSTFMNVQSANIDAGRGFGVNTQGGPSRMSVGGLTQVGALDPIYPDYYVTFPGQNIVNYHNGRSTSNLYVDGGNISGQYGGPGAEWSTGGIRLGVTSPGNANVYGGGALTSNFQDVVVGYTANGSINLNNGSLRTQRDVIVGANTDVIGMLNLSTGATVNAREVMLGWNGAASIGRGIMVANNSTITANVTIGANSSLGGNGTIIGNVVNYGTINPGNSPGRFVIDGTLTSAAGSKVVLEVQRNVDGSYTTDQLVFKEAAVPSSLGDADVTLTFLGTTDPVAFFASSSFSIDTFFKVQTTAGDISLSQALDQTAIDSFFAASTLQYALASDPSTTTLLSSAADAQFLSDSVSAVPEPAEYALMGAGLLIASWTARAKGRRLALSKAGLAK